MRAVQVLWVGLGLLQGAVLALEQSARAGMDRYCVALALSQHRVEVCCMRAAVCAPIVACARVVAASTAVADSVRICKWSRMSLRQWALNISDGYSRCGE